MRYKYFLWLVFVSVSVAATAAGTTLPDSVLSRLAQVAIHHNGRVAPVRSFADDFAREISGGHDTRDGMRLVGGLVFHFSSWADEPLVFVETDTFRRCLGTKASHASWNEYCRAVADGRIDLTDSVFTAAHYEDLSRFEAHTRLAQGRSLRLFPVDGQWYSPVDNLPPGIETDQWIFVRKFLGLVNEKVRTHDYASVVAMFDKLALYQQQQDAGVPGPHRVALERVYRVLAPGKGAAAVLLGLGMIATLLCLVGLPVPRWLLQGVAASVAMWLGAAFGLRWWLAGYFPLATGYETMCFMALVAVLAGAMWRGRYGALMSAMSLLVAGATVMAGAATSSIGLSGLNPALASPLLSYHVGAVMISYTMFMLMALCSAIACCGHSELVRLSRAMLLPGVVLLFIGIVIGSVWAKDAWGSYWSWDPKETWALITLVVYLVPLCVPRAACRLYFIFAFVSVLVTYFGVNFFMGGLHSYV